MKGGLAMTRGLGTTEWPAPLLTDRLVCDIISIPNGREVEL